MGYKKTGTNHIENMVAQLGTNGACERLSGYIADICKAAPASEEVDDAINLLLLLKGDVLKGRFNPVKEKEG